MSRNVDWSKLCPDLLRSIFESLSSLDFHRAKTVCSNWYTVSRTCPLYPWRIVLQGQNSLLYDPIQDKVYHKNLLGIDLSEVHCLASYSNWLLLVDPCLHFHLLNVFTSETISVPSLDSSLGDSPYRFVRNDLYECFLELYGTKFLVSWDDFKFSKTAVLWINERNGDFVVAWAIKQFYILSYKKIANDGDKGWRITCTQCEDMAYKDNKLYVYTYDHYINFLDFSGDCPKETLEGNHYLNHPFPFVVTIYKMRIAIANSGEVMIFLSLNELNRKFCICELNLQVGRVGSLGDQLLIFGHGVTIRGPVKDRGIKSDSVCLLMMIICLVIICGEERSKVWCVDLATSTITWCT